MKFDFKTSWETIKSIRSLGMVLPAVMTIATQHPRYLPDIQWSDKSWVHNIFRVYEIIFWRRNGIRLESMTECGEDGRIRHYFHTVESVLAFAESKVRGLVPKFEKVYLPVLAPAGFGSFNNPASRPYLFAIAFQALTTGSNTLTSLSFSVTTSGSDRCLVAGVFDQGGQPGDGGAGNVTSSTYNSVAMAQSFSGVGSASDSNGAVHLYILANPATGANTYATARTTSRGDILAYVVNVSNYTGCKQTGQPDSAAKNEQQTTTPMTLATTVVASNCWLVGYANNNGVTFSVGTGTTSRVAGNRAADSNGTVGTGSRSLQWTWTNSGGVYQYGIVYSVAPVAVVATGGFFLAAAW